jgi:Zn-dependent protease
VSVDWSAVAAAGALVGLGSLMAGPTSAVLLTATVMGSVLVHELGHAFEARALGLSDISVHISGLGGRARHEPSLDPWVRLRVAFAGPLTSGTLGSFSLLVWAVARGALPARIALILGAVAAINLGWAMVNLLPLPQLDGGICLLAIQQIWRTQHEG